MKLGSEPLASQTGKKKPKLLSTVDRRLEYPTSLEIRLGRNGDEIGEGHRDDVTFNDSFICCVNAVSWQ